MSTKYTDLRRLERETPDAAPSPLWVQIDTDFTEHYLRAIAAPS